MKTLRVEKELILKLLENVGNAITNKPTIPIMSNIVVEITTTKKEENELKVLSVKGTNGVVAIKSSANDSLMQFDSEENFDFCVDYKVFIQAISKCQKTITIELEDNRLLIKSGKLKYKINLSDITSYPHLEFAPTTKKENFLIKNTLLLDINKKVAPYCSDRDTKPILTGINFKKVKNVEKTQIIATDSFKLSCLRTILSTPSHETEESEYDFTLPKDTLNFISKIIKTSSRNAVLKEETKCVVDNTSFYCMVASNESTTIVKNRLLEGKYPDVSRLLNYGFGYVVLNKEEIIESLDSVLVLGDNYVGSGESFSGLLGIEFTSSQKDNQEALVIAENNVLGVATNQCTIKENFLEENILIWCNGLTLKNALNNVECSNVKFHLDSATRPIFIIGSEDTQSDFIQIVLPIKKN